MCPNSRRAFLFSMAEAVKKNIVYNSTTYITYCCKEQSLIKKKDRTLFLKALNSVFFFTFVFIRLHLILKTLTLTNLFGLVALMFVYVGVTVLLVWLVSEDLLYFVTMSVCVCVCCWSNRSVSSVSPCQCGWNEGITTMNTTTNRANMWLKNTAGTCYTLMLQWL